MKLQALVLAVCVCAAAGHVPSRGAVECISLDDDDTQDIQIMPGCSMEAIVGSYLVEFMDYSIGYPFGNFGDCALSTKGMFKRFVKNSIECLRPICEESVLGNLMTFYAEEAAEKIFTNENVEEIWQSFLKEYPESIEDVLDELTKLICPVKGSMAPMLVFYETAVRMIETMLTPDLLQSFDIMGSFLFGNLAGKQSCGAINEHMSLVMDNIEATRKALRVALKDRPTANAFMEMGMDKLKTKLVGSQKKLLENLKTLMLCQPGHDEF